jgi:hypothetical protein
MVIRTTDAFTIGHTRVTIIVAGCVDCGAMDSPGAEEAVQHMMQIGDRKRRIALKRCAGCAEKRGARWPREVQAA